MGAINECLGEIEFAASLQILCERVQHTLERAVSHPLLKSPMAGLIWRVPSWEILPGCAGTQDPEYAVQNIARIAVGPASNASLRRLLDGKQRPQKRPLFIGEVHCNL